MMRRLPTMRRHRLAFNDLRWTYHFQPQRDHVYSSHASLSKASTQKVTEVDPLTLGLFFHSGALPCIRLIGWLCHSRYKLRFFFIYSCLSIVPFEEKSGGKRRTLLFRFFPKLSSPCFLFFSFYLFFLSVDAALSVESVFRLCGAHAPSLTNNIVASVATLLIRLSSRG